VPLYLEWAPTGVFSSVQVKSDDHNNPEDDKLSVSDLDKARSEKMLALVSNTVIIILKIHVSS